MSLEFVIPIICWTIPIKKQTTVKITWKMCVPVMQCSFKKKKRREKENVGKMSFFRLPRILFRKSASGLWYPAVSSPEFMRMHVIVPIVQLIDHSRSANDQVLRSAPKNILHAWSPIVTTHCLRLITRIQTARMEILFPSLSRPSNVYDTVLRSVRFGQWYRRNIRGWTSERLEIQCIINKKFCKLLTHFLDFKLKTDKRKD